MSVLSGLKPLHVTYYGWHDLPISLWIINECLKYYLKHEQECFIGYKTRGAAERFISDKTWQRVFWIA
jgi:hypothetical protein